MLENLYDYQKDAVIATDKNDKGIVCMPTGSGKTFVQAAVIAKDILKNKDKFGIYVINAPRIMLSYQLLKEVYTFLVNEGIEARYMSVHSGGQNDIEDLEKIRVDANLNDGVSIPFSEIQNGTSPTLIREFTQTVKGQNLPLIFFSTYNSADRINDAIPHDKINIVVNDEAQYLVQEQFHDIIHTLNCCRCYFFTATTIHTPSDTGRGMNNTESYGEIIYLMTPRQAIDMGKMVRPRMHFVIPPNDATYNKEDFEKSIGKIIVEALAQHRYSLQGARPKMLISVKGTSNIETFFQSKEYKMLLRTGVMIYAVASNEKIGNNINGEKVTRRDFLNRLKADGKDRSKEIIILHYDILAEGIDVPGITGIMPLRTLAKAKFLQTFGRAARLDVEDRERIESGEITPDQLDEMNKPFAWVIVPTIVHEDADSKEHIGNLITELRDYGFKPSEDIVSTDTKKGLVVKEGPESLTDLVDKCPNIGEYIEKVEASYEELRIASLTEEEWLVHNFPELKDII
jgi:superfamily II DNA or RNA helicase